MNFLPNHEYFNEPKFRSVSGLFSFILHFLGFKNVKINVFCEKIFLGAFFIKSKCMCLRTGPGDLNKHQTFEI